MMSSQLSHTTSDRTRAWTIKVVHQPTARSGDELIILEKSGSRNLHRVEGRNFIKYTTRIISAYVAGNAVAAAELPAMIASVHTALVDMTAPNISLDNVFAFRLPIDRKSSVRHDRIVSLIDGRLYKTLKRHLTANGFTPEGYRSYYGLPADYPMVAPAYAAARARIAMQTFHGRKAV